MQGESASRRAVDSGIDRKKERRAGRRARGVAVEALEHRRLLAADPGDTLATALDLGPVTAAPTSVAEQVGPSDPVDVYRFGVSGVRDVTAAVDPSNSADLWLELVRDRNANGVLDSGDVFYSERSNAGGTVTLFQRLAEGTYFARVTPRFSTDVPYTLTLSGVEAPPDPG